MLRNLAIVTLLASPASAQDFFTLKGHGGPIMDIAVSGSGTIATASFDNSVGVWDGTKPKWLEGHRAAVNTVIFPEEGVILAGGDDFKIRGWVLSDDSSFEVGQHEAKVTALVAAPHELAFASSSWDSTVKIWKPIHIIRRAGDDKPAFKTFTLTGHAQGVNDIAYSADGRSLYSASTDGTIRVWDTTSGEEKRIAAKHGFGVNQLILNDAEGWLAYGAVDGGTRIIDPETGAQIADFTLGRRPILAMAYDPIESQLAIGDGEGFIMVIDTKAMRITRDFKATQRGPIWALAFSPDGKSIHAGGIEDIMYSWPVETLTEHGQMAGGVRSFLENPETLPNGERQFKRKCSICHTLTEGSARKAGPSLYGIFGRRAGAVEDYTYSSTLNGSEIVWSEKTIDALFDLGPDHYIPGTKMPMQRIVQQSDRDDLIAYLRDATAKGED